MTCLCNIRLDLQSDAIVEPKTKAWVIFLTNVNTLHKRVYSQALKQDVGNTGLCALGVSVVPSKEILINLPRKACNHFLKLLSCVAVIN